MELDKQLTIDNIMKDILEAYKKTRNIIGYR